jgi:hypothetical protein
MAGTLGTSAYLDVPGYLRAPAGQETASLVGLNTTLGGAGTIAAGTTALPVASSTGWAAGPLWILDGPYSELAQVTGSPDGTHLTLAAPGTAFAHAGGTAGVSTSQAGSGGSLAEALLRASAWIENYCRQGSATTDRSLFAVSRAERWGMPGARAWLDGDDVLAVRPGHFPVQSVASLTVTLPDGTALALDVSQAQAVSSGRLIELPLTLLAGAYPVMPSGPLLSRSRRQWVSLSYTGGIAVGSVPYDVQQACVWVTSELLAERRNPWGAARVRQGKFELEARLRGDTSGDSILLMQAKAALEPYRAH